jgi:RsiW-degrading membrane proteinase PrsW (M82 family)
MLFLRGMETLILLRNVALATLPGIFWFWWYIRQDQGHPEPRRYLWRVFLLGMLVTIPALLIEFTIDLFFPFSREGFTQMAIFGALFVVAPVEEIAKFLIVWTGVYRTRFFDERLDGVVYMVVAALGFATIENILVVLREGASILPLRFVTATLLHALASGTLGYFLGLAKFNRRRSTLLIVLGLVISIAIHGLYDLVAISTTDMKLVLLIIFMALLYLLLEFFVRRAKKQDGD